MTITITPTQLLPLQVRVQKALDLKTLFGAVDSAGTIDHYKISATAGFGGSITDTTTSTTIVAGQTLTAAAGDNLTYTASGATGTESFTIQASDDNQGTFSNAVTVSESVVANTAPTVMGVVNDPNTITVNKTFGAAQLFQATDVNFDPIATYTLTTPTAGGGVFTMINGAHTTDPSNTTGALAAGTTYTISGADLANLTFKTPGTTGNVTFQVAASDGVQTGATLPITLNVQTNTAPTVATPTPAKPILIGNSFTPASSLIKASDLDGSTITGYSITVQPTNKGFFTLTHDATPVAVDGSNQFFVTAAQFASLEYRSNLTTAGTDAFSVTAIATPDLTHPASVVFSQQTPLSVNVVASAPPVVTQNAGSSSVATGATVNLSALLTATDPKGSPVAGYSIIPSASGQILQGGVALAANTPTFVSAANFSLLQFVAGATPGTTQFQVAASDGTDLGNFTTISVTAAAASPVITKPSTVPTIEPNVPVAVSSLFNGSEPGGSIQGFSIIVPSSLGHLTLNGTTLPTDQPVLISTSDFANLKFVATAAPGSASLQAAAYDGKVFSTYASVPLNLVGPTVSQASTLGANSLVTSTTYSAAKLFSLNKVAGGAAVTGLSIQTPPASEGTFYNGTTALASNQPVFVNASDLANLTLQTSASAGPVTFQVSAFDGIAFGQPKQFLLNSVANTEPTVTPTGANPQVTVGHSVLAASLFSANDINGDAITAYQITPGATAGAGVFSEIGLTFTPGSPTTVTAAQLASLKYTAGGPAPVITIAGNVSNPGPNGGLSAIPGSYTLIASDGASYTATLQLDFPDDMSAQLEIATLTPIGSAPAVTASTPISLGTVAFDGGGTATGFTPAAGAVAISASGSLPLSANTLNFSQLVATAPATDATTSVTSFQTGQDSFTVKATDDPGASDFSQSTAATVKVTAVANQPPVTVPLPQTLPILTGSTVSATSLFNTADPEGDAVQGYSIIAPSAAVGSFSGYNSITPTGLIYVSAANLANLKFTAGAQVGPANIQVAAFDGQSWGNYATVPITLRDPQPAAVTLTPPTVLRPNTTIAASSLFSATDPRGATIQGYSITTPAGDNGFFTLNGVALPSNTQNYISASQLSSLAFVGGSANKAATFTVAAYNGTRWSDLSTETVNVSAYTPPVVKLATSSPTVVAGGSTAVAALIKSVATDSSAPVQQYVVSASDGSFLVNGKTTSAKIPLTVSAADFATLQFIAPAATGNVTVNIAANDGTATGTSAAMTLAVTTNAGPTVSQSNLITTLLPGQTYAAGTLFSGTDPSGLPITGYFVTAQTGDGRFQIKNPTTGAITAIPQGTKQFVTAANLANLQYVTGSSVSAKGALAPTGTVLAIPDANQGSGYSSATVTLEAPPAGGTQATATAQVVNGKVVSITVTDPGSGYTKPIVASISGDGTGASGPVLDLSQPFSTFTVSASDSVTEGAAVTVLVNPLANITTTTVIPVTPTPKVAPAGTINVSSLLSAVGAGGVPIAAYNLSTDLGTFTLNGTPLTSGQLSFITPDIFAQLVYTAPAVPGTAHIQALASDGSNHWSPAVQIVLGIA